MKKRLLLVALLVGLLSLGASAQPPFGGAGGHNMMFARGARSHHHMCSYRMVDMMAKPLGLTSVQQRKLKDVLIDAARKRIMTEGQLKLKKFDLGVLLYQDHPNAKKVKDLAADVAGLEASLEEARVDTMLACKSILSAEQQHKMRKMMLMMHHGGMHDRGAMMWRHRPSRR